MATSEDEAPVEAPVEAPGEAPEEAPVEDDNYVAYDSADSDAALNDRYEALPDGVELHSSEEEPAAPEVRTLVVVCTLTQISDVGMIKVRQIFVMRKLILKVFLYSKNFHQSRSRK